MLVGTDREPGNEPGVPLLSPPASGRSKNPDTGEPINPDFAAMARSAGIEGVRVDKSVALGEAVDNAIKSERPFVIDANIQGDDNPGGAGVWELPGLSHGQPQIGEQYLTNG